jgi:hypothetical protein
VSGREGEEERSVSELQKKEKIEGERELRLARGGRQNNIYILYI